MAARLRLDPTPSTGLSPVAGHPRSSIPAGPSLVELLQRHGPAEGASLTALPWLQVQRASRPRPRAPVVSQPSVCIVAQGSKEAYLGGETYTYDALHYLVLSVPLPIEARIVEASPERPYLSLRIEVDPVLLGELLFDLGAVGAEAGADEPGRGARRGIFVSPLDERLQEAAYEVGYGSPSQFSREFRRLFGASPRDEVRRLAVERVE